MIMSFLSKSHFVEPETPILWGLFSPNNHLCIYINLWVGHKPICGISYLLDSFMHKNSYPEGIHFIISYVCKQEL